MEKEFVSYELALKLKELGFDEPCFGYPKQGTVYPINTDLLPEWSAAPLFQQAFRWFREKHGLWQIVMQNTDKDWTYDIIPIIGMIDYKLFDVFDTYEEAELACLTKLIEIAELTKD